MNNTNSKACTKSSVGPKIIFIGILVFVLLVPTTMIQGLVKERKHTLQDAQKEVSAKWGLEQRMSGPILTIPYKTHIRDKYNRVIKTNFHNAHFLPDILNIKGDINPEIRSRGIFDVVLYTTDVNLSGTFSRPDFSKFDIPNQDIVWEEAFLSIGIPDLRGLKDQIKITWNEDKVALGSGFLKEQIFKSGLGAVMPNMKNADFYAFSLDLKLNGSQEVSFLPLGQETNILLSSSWPNPSFNGAFLPIEHEITDEGFTARWKILDLNRNYPQAWNDRTYTINDSAFGLKLLMPVDSYQQTTRSIKYAALFIVLTFLTFFLVEILNKFKIHPLQYLLVGSAIILFYLLLLSLSEHINFDLSYLLASLGIIGMVSLYTGAILHKKIMAVLLLVVLTGLYIYLYVLLQLEDYALLLGSSGLFITLGTVMYLTRKINWYTLNASDSD